MKSRFITIQLILSIVLYSTHAFTQPRLVMGMKSFSDNFYKICRTKKPVDSLTATIIKSQFEELNRARSNPSLYGKEISINLDSFSTRPALIYDSLLATIAQIKAEDMFLNKYISHIDPWGNSIGRYIVKAIYQMGYAHQYATEKNIAQMESLAGYYKTGHGEQTGWQKNNYIAQLIIDKGLPNAGHRKHLLGANPVCDRYVGIGLYKGYFCIIITDKDNYR